MTTPSGLDEVGFRARLGDPVAAQALRSAGHAIGVVIGTICNFTGPGSVILSGEGIEVVDVMMESIERGITSVIHPALPPVSVIVTPLSFTDWARGAAIVAIAHHLDLRSGLVA
jgi:predicted NBD/HSP70 family sugar kinase